MNKNIPLTTIVQNLYAAFGRSDVPAILAGPREVAWVVVIDTTVRTTGRRVRLESLHHFTFDEAGLASRFREFTDTLAIVERLGKNPGGLVGG